MSNQSELAKNTIYCFRIYFILSPTIDRSKFKHDSLAFWSKLHSFHDFIAPQLLKEAEHKENQTKFRKMTRKPLSHVRI